MKKKFQLYIKTNQTLIAYILYSLEYTILLTIKFQLEWLHCKTTWVEAGILKDTYKRNLPLSFLLTFLKKFPKKPSISLPSLLIGINSKCHFIPHVIPNKMAGHYKQIKWQICLM